MSKPPIPTDFDRNDDLDIKRGLQHELNYRLGQRLVDEAAPGRYKMAVLSAVNGKWDDVMKDVRRGRITKEQAKGIIDSMLRVRLLTPMLGVTFRERIDGTELDSRPTIAHEGKETD